MTFISILNIRMFKKYMAVLSAKLIIIFFLLFCLRSSKVRKLYQKKIICKISILSTFLFSSLLNMRKLKNIYIWSLCPFSNINIINSTHI